MYSRKSAPKNENLSKMYLASGLPRCKWVCSSEPIWRHMSNITQVAVQYGWLRSYNSSMARVCKCITNNNGVSLKNTLLCRTTSRHRFKYHFDSLTAKPKPPLLIRKHHFRTSNEGTLSCLIESLLYYCIKSAERLLRPWSSHLRKRQSKFSNRHDLY